MKPIPPQQESCYKKMRDDNKEILFTLHLLEEIGIRINLMNEILDRKLKENDIKLKENDIKLRENDIKLKELREQMNSNRKWEQINKRLEEEEE